MSATVLFQAAEYLGPASVIRLEGATPICEVPEVGEVRAELALAFPYEPTLGDELLVIGKRDRYWVIGVLRARGEVSLRFMGCALYGPASQQQPRASVCCCVSASICSRASSWRSRSTSGLPVVSSFSP